MKYVYACLCGVCEERSGQEKVEGNGGCRGQAEALFEGKKINCANKITAHLFLA